MIDNQDRAEIIDFERHSWIGFIGNSDQLFLTRSIYRVSVPLWARDLDDGELEALLWLLVINLRSNREENISVQLFLPGQAVEGCPFATLTWTRKVILGTSRTFNMVAAEWPQN